MEDVRLIKKWKKEKVPIFVVYKEGNEIKTDAFDETKDFELYGFLYLFLKGYGKYLVESIYPKEKGDDFD